MPGITLWEDWTDEADADASMEPRRDAGDNGVEVTADTDKIVMLQWSPGVMPGITAHR